MGGANSILVDIELKLVEQFVILRGQNNLNSILNFLEIRFSKKNPLFDILGVHSLANASRARQF